MFMVSSLCCLANLASVDQLVGNGAALVAEQTGFTAQGIDLHSNWFQMIWITASAITAGMVKEKSFGDWANNELVHQAVYHQFFSLVMDTSVSISIKTPFCHKPASTEGHHEDTLL
jgi:hypothetical protein